MVVAKRGPTFFRARFAAMALLLIAVGAALRTYSLARFAAKALHGELQQNLLPNRVGELKPAVIVKSDIGVVFRQRHLGPVRCVLRRLVDEIEFAADRNCEAFQTTVAGAFDFAGQMATDTDLTGAWAIFSVTHDLQGFWLKQLTRPEIERSWGDGEVELDFANL